MSHDTYPADMSVHKSTLIDWMQKLTQAFADTIEGKYDGWEDDLVTLSDKIGDIITKESVPGV